MSYPGADYGRIYPEAMGANQQLTQGIDPDWTQLATMYGFRPNPYPAAGTEGQDQMRFLATLKSIADAQLGGPSGPYSQMAPNNPIAAMPFGMSQYMAAMAPLFQSIQGRNLMPLDQANMFAGGYQYGPLGTGTESALMKVLREQRAGGATGQTPYAGPPGGGPAPSATPSAGVPSATEQAAAQVSGGNTPIQTPPSSTLREPATPPASATPTTATQDITAGLRQQESPKFGYDTERRGDILYAKSSNKPVAHLENGTWTQSNDESANSKSATSGTVVAGAMGEKFSNFGSGIADLLKQVDQWDQNTRRSVADIILKGVGGQ